MTMLMCPDVDVLELMSGRESDREDEDECVCERKSCLCVRQLAPVERLYVDADDLYVDADDIGF